MLRLEESIRCTPVIQLPTPSLGRKWTLWRWQSGLLRTYAKLKVLKAKYGKAALPEQDPATATEVAEADKRNLGLEGANDGQTGGAQVASHTPSNYGRPATQDRIPILSKNRHYLRVLPTTFATSPIFVEQTAANATLCKALIRTAFRVYPSWQDLLEVRGNKRPTSVLGSPWKMT